MAELTVDTTYGKALFLAAKKSGKLEEMYTEGEALSDLFRQEKAFYDFICSPIISGGEKKTVVRKVLENRVSPEMVNFLLILIDKGRGRHFERILGQYRKLLNQSQGFTTGMLYSVSPLSKEQIAAFEERTAKLLSKEVKLTNKIDAGLLGGVRIFVDGKLIDSSVKKRLADLVKDLEHLQYT